LLQNNSAEAPAAVGTAQGGRTGLWPALSAWLVPPGPQRDVALDFVRGVAILLAMGRHFNEVTGNPVVDALLAPGRVIGWAGVDLFFVLSGFLVGGLVLQEVQRTRAFDARRFLVRRALKLWPVLYCYLLLLLVTGRHPWQDYLFQTALHVQNYFVTNLAHLWSLAVEEHFYTVLCLLVVWLLRKGWAKAHVLVRLAVGIFVACLLLRTAAYFSGKFTVTQIQWQTQFRIDALSCGVLLAYLRWYRSELFFRLGRPKVLLFVLWLAGSVLLAVGEGIPGFRPTVGYTLGYATAACFLLFCVNLPIMQRRPFAVRAVAFIGLYSYAMYVYQFVGLRAAEAGLARWGLGEPDGVLGVVLKYATAIVTAVVVTKLIEHPVLRLRERLFSQADAKAP
jgi:peptidoglycan/LPS O-acetylase OafA/YrhL